MKRIPASGGPGSESNGNGRHREQSTGRPARTAAARPVLITGGAGFIGTNVAARLAQSGYSLLIYDNLSRPGVERNLRWLVEEFGPQVEVQMADVRDAPALQRAVRRAETVFHFAAQVAVTTSLIDPPLDFEINARGTLNLLEACRQVDDPPAVLFTSTNKVYGGLDDVRLVRRDSRYQPEESSLLTYGISEQRPLDFHSPYGCSKGTAEQYVLDYARCYDLPAVVFRMSCIYGPHQCGTEDQGWVAHFVRQTLQGLPLTFYGDGRQVRDLLFVEDLVDAMLLAVRQIDATRGKAFNIGGGPNNAVSLLELMELITMLHGQRPEIRYDEWRHGDQRYYVSDTRKFQATTGWKPRTAVPIGVARLYEWLREHEFTLPTTSVVRSSMTA